MELLGWHWVERGLTAADGCVDGGIFLRFFRKNGWNIKESFVYCADDKPISPRDESQAVYIIDMRVGSSAGSDKPG